MSATDLGEARRSRCYDTPADPMTSARSTEVLIVGAGPTGLVLPLWLVRLGVEVRIVDKTAEPGTTSRALAPNRARLVGILRNEVRPRTRGRAGRRSEALPQGARDSLAAGVTRTNRSKSFRTS